MSDTALPGVTLDPKNESELEAAFGVTSNAEELVRQNRSRYTTEHRAALTQQVDVGLTSELYVGNPELKLDPVSGSIAWDYGASRQLKSELTDAVGHEIEAAVVRGSGSRAVISYVYPSGRGSLEKDVIPFAQVFGTAEQKASAKKDATPTEAANSVLGDAETEAGKLISEAKAEAAKVVQDAKDEIAKLISEAEAEAQKIREKAAEEAPKVAEEAAAEAAKGEGGKPAKRGGRKAS
jgi:vacuolar-type H+-ATPase subunit H